MKKSNPCFLQKSDKRYKSLPKDGTFQQHAIKIVIEVENVFNYCQIDGGTTTTGEKNQQK